MRRRAVVLAAVVAATAASATAACGSGDPVPGRTATSAAMSAPAPPATTPTTPPPPDAAGVRARGSALTSGDVTLALLPASETAFVTVESPQGGVQVSVDGPVDVAAPEGSTLSVLADGTLLVVDGSGAPVAGLSGAPATAVTDEVARLDVPAGSQLWFSSSAVESLDWGEREGGESLGVVPTAWARASGAAAQDLVWTQVVAREPRADTPSMHDQLLCHMLGAPDKEQWNLEPWRPEVDGFTMIAERCNPE